MQRALYGDSWSLALSFKDLAWDKYFLWSEASKKTKIFLKNFEAKSRNIALKSLIKSF